MAVEHFTGVFLAWEGTVDHAQQLCTARRQHEILPVATLGLGAGRDETTLQQRGLVVVGLGLERIEVVDRLAGLLQRVCQFLGAAAWYEWLAGAVLHLVEHTLDKIPVMGLLMSRHRLVSFYFQRLVRL